MAITSILSLALSNSVLAADSSGSVKFTGEIIKAACNVSINGVVDGSVDLQKWPTSTFQAVGDTTIPQPFTVDVKDCLAGDFKFNFTGNTDDTNPDLLKVSEAKGVGIAIANTDGTLVKLNTTGTNSNANLTIAPNAKQGSLPLLAYYKSTLGDVTPGIADATVRVTLQQK